MKYPKDQMRIKTLLAHLNLTAYQLAKELEYRSPSSVYHVERGLAIISNQMAKKIIDRYPIISFGYLIGKSPNLIADPQEQNQQIYFKKAAIDYEEENFVEKFENMSKDIKFLKQKVEEILKILSKK